METGPAHTEATPPATVDAEPAATAGSAVFGRSLFSELIAVVTLSLLGATTAVAYTALIFSGPLDSGLGTVATSAVFGSGVLATVVAWRSGFSIVIAGIQDLPAIVFAPAAVGIAATAGDAAVPTIVVALAFATMLSGLSMALIGRQRLARLLRFMPTTVVVGFVAGTGWFLVKGGFDVMTRRTLHWDDIGKLFTSDLAERWIPGLVLAALVFGVGLAKRAPAALGSALIVASALLFFVIVSAVSSIQSVEDGGWLVGPFPDREPLGLITPDRLADADWGAVAGASGSIAAVVAISVIGILLNLSGIRVIRNEKIDPDRELVTAGAANVLIAPFGGLTGYHLIGGTALASTIGARRRIVAVIVGVLVCVIAVAGGSAVGFLPRFVAGGLLIAAGSELLANWLIELRATSSWFDRAVSVLIVASMATIGILEGIVVGIVAACMFFVVRYSRIDAVRLVSNVSERRSVVARNPHEDDLLDEYGHRIVVFELHGYLFFGSVSNAAERIVETAQEVQATEVIIDTARVSGTDSSAFAGLAELGEKLASIGTRVRWSSMSTDDLANLQRLCDDDLFFDVDLDRAIEAAEDSLIAVTEIEHAPTTDDDVQRAERTSSTAASYSSELLAFFEPREYDDGELLTKEGAESDELLVVVRGQLHVYRDRGNGVEHRLRTLRDGAIVGEMGFLTGSPRTASVAADGPVEVVSLSTEAHARLRKDRPDLALELYDHVLRGTADRAIAIHRSLTDALR